MIEGHSNKSMGLTLDLSPRTVEDYRLNCLQKLGVASSSAAIRIGLEAGIHLDS
jgi:DNA-binding NarL/FixJ family response regulator